MPALKYKIVEAAAAQQLEWHVNLWIDKGWVPIGGLAVGPGNLPLKQAMVKHDPTPTPPRRAQRKLLEGEIAEE